jgi:hypothetical protein
MCLTTNQQNQDGNGYCASCQLLISRIKKVLLQVNMCPLNLFGLRVEKNIKHRTKKLELFEDDILSCRKHIATQMKHHI